MYRARHRDGGDEVALKTVRVPRVALLSGIRREIHALARLRNPGIVRILDEGVDQGLPWYTMELLQGTSLRRVLGGSSGGPETRTEPPKAVWWTHTLDDAAGPAAAGASGDGAGPGVARGRNDLQGVLRAVRRLCRPLAYLHGEGLLHGDLKPDNVLVRPDGSPVLVDFGLAARFTGELSRDALDGDAGSGGTLAFMAPEQLRGELLDARADLYALGCILHWALTGRAPFSTLDEVRDSQSEARAPSALRPGLPAELDELVLGLLRKSPRERIGHADVVAARLDALAGGAGPDDPGPPARAYLYRAGMAGRDELVEALGRHVFKELRAGSGGLVLVGGESGIGKTRLALELARRVQAQGRAAVLVGECAPGGGPLHPLRPVLQHIADRCREQGPAETAHLLGPRGRVLEPYAPDLAGLPGQGGYPALAEMPPEEARLRLFDALAAALAALAGRQPVLLLLDDLQWADSLSLEFLEHMVHSAPLRNMPLFVTGTYRSEELEDGLRKLLEAPQVRSLLLQRLDEQAVGSMVGDMLALSPAPALFARAVARRSEGNPFFVAEYLRAAVDEGLLYRGPGGRWDVAEAGEATADEATYERLPLPTALRDLVARRLDRLSPAARTLAEIASVLGREADLGLLAEIACLAELESWEAVQELLARQVLEELAAGRLRFVHDQIREAAYARIAGPERRELHRRAATVLEPRCVAGQDALPALLAALGHHWEQAQIPQKAREAYDKGAHAAQEQHALAEAEQLYRACLRLCEPGSLQRAEAHRMLGFAVLRTRGRPTEAIQELELAVQAARELGDRKAESQSLLNLSSTLREVGRMAEAGRLCQQVLILARELGDLGQEATALANLGMIGSEQGRMQEAADLQRKALGIFHDIGDRRSEGMALGYLAILANDQGRLDEAEALYDQAIALHRELGYRRGEGISLGNLANVYSDQGRMEESHAAYEAAVAIHREIGTRRFEGMSLGNMGLLRLEQGDEAGAQALYEQALEIHRQVHNRRFEAMVLANLASLMTLQGRLGLAEALFEQALGIERELGDRRTEGATLSHLLALRIRAGPPGRGACPGQAGPGPEPRGRGPPIRGAEPACMRQPGAPQRAPGRSSTPSGWGRGPLAGAGPSAPGLHLPVPLRARTPGPGAGQARRDPYPTDWHPDGGASARAPGRAGPRGRQTQPRRCDARGRAASDLRRAPRGPAGRAPGPAGRRRCRGPHCPRQARPAGLTRTASAQRTCRPRSGAGWPKALPRPALPSTSQACRPDEGGETQNHLHLLLSWTAEPVGTLKLHVGFVLALHPVLASAVHWSKVLPGVQMAFTSSLAPWRTALLQVPKPFGAQSSAIPLGMFGSPWIVPWTFCTRLPASTATMVTGC